MAWSTDKLALALQYHTKKVGNFEEKVHRLVSIWGFSAQAKWNTLLNSHSLILSLAFSTLQIPTRLTDFYPE
ncbi:unnamed protein product [Blepharisma stoltei]|uniref:Uncharacterized protein n=1 Tax=Blepharisma stoltei TaxID=1481888 RepID=A0AAU9JLM7_9CILI|nr:unnamed protein product [Blepharisma stoltei]